MKRCWLDRLETLYSEYYLIINKYLITKRGDMHSTSRAIRGDGELIWSIGEDFLGEPRCDEMSGNLSEPGREPSQHRQTPAAGQAQ